MRRGTKAHYDGHLRPRYQLFRGVCYVVRTLFFIFGDENLEIADGGGDLLWHAV